MGAGHLDIWRCPNIQGAPDHIGAYKHMGGVWMPPKSQHTSKLKSYAKSFSTAVVTVFLSSSGLEGVWGSKDSVQGETLDNGL